MVVTGGAVNALFSMHRGAGAAVRSGLKGAAYSGVAWIPIYSIVHPGLKGAAYGGGAGGG